MRILISGKGGSGKSTLSALVARALKDRGFRVLLVDADESNYGLHRLLDISFPVPLLENMGGKPGFKKMTSVTFPQPAAEPPFKNGLESMNSQRTALLNPMA
jgi:CO dehydrogenase maturation factor